MFQTESGGGGRCIDDHNPGILILDGYLPKHSPWDLRSEGIVRVL